jgi:uncharacterized repeat protein (TIGR03803 family)
MRSLSKLLLALASTAISFAASAEEIGTVKDVQVSVLHDFHHEWNGREGAEPGTLAIGRDGALYGTTASGGTYGAGTIFRIKPGGAFETLHVFTGQNGYRPTSCLLPAADGALYGTTGLQLTGSESHVFRVTPAGVVEHMAVLRPTYTAEGRRIVQIRGSDQHLYRYDNFERPSLELRWHKDFAPAGPVFQILGDQPRRQLSFAESAVAAVTPVPTKALVPADSNAFCGNFMVAHDGRLWGPQYREGGLGKGASTDPANGMDYPVRLFLEPPGTTRSPTQNPDLRIAGSGFGRPVQAADGTIFATANNYQNGVKRYAVIGISVQGAVVTQTPLDVADAGGQPVFGLVAGRDGYFYGLVQGWGTPARKDAGTPSLMYRLRSGGPIELVHVFAGAAPEEPHLPGPIVPDPRDGGFYVTFSNGGTNHQGVIYRIVVPR